MDFWYLFRVVPRHLNFGRFRYFPKCFPAYSTLTRESVFPIFSFLETKKISSHHNFFSFFPFPLFLPSSTTTCFPKIIFFLSFHFPPPQISSTSPSTSPLSLASPHWPRRTPHLPLFAIKPLSSTLIASPLQISNPKLPKANLGLHLHLKQLQPWDLGSSWTYRRPQSFGTRKSFTQPFEVSIFTHQDLINS